MLTDHLGRPPGCPQLPKKNHKLGGGGGIQGMDMERPNTFSVALEVCYRLEDSAMALHIDHFTSKVGGFHIPDMKAILIQILSLAMQIKQKDRQIRQMTASK